MHVRNTIQSLIKLGHTKTEISKLIGCHRNTVSNIENEDPVKSEPKQREINHPLDEHREFIEKWLSKKITLVRIYEKLQKEHNYPYQYDSLRRYVKRQKLKNRPVYMVLNTSPGEEAQVDFGYVGLRKDQQGKTRKAYAFAMTMGYSRVSYFEIVFDQRVDTFIQCHINAFEYFGGVPKTVKIDNLKAAILEASFYEPEYQKEYQELADYYGFISLPCKVRYPQEKGKVESAIKYIKNNFMAGRRFKDFAELKTKLREWQEEVCNKRIHGTTKKIPQEVFRKEEQSKLKELPAKAWEVYQIAKRKVSPTCHIMMDNNYYSVPYKYVGEIVEVKISRQMIRIYYQEQEIASHLILSENGQYQTQQHHYPDYKGISTTEYQQRQGQKMREIGEEAYEYFNKLMKQYPHHWGNKINGILQLSRQYGKEAVNLSCKRANQFEVYTYEVIKNICRKGLFKEVVETTTSNSDPIISNIVTTKPVTASRTNNNLCRPLSYYSQLFISITLIVWNMLITLFEV